MASKKSIYSSLLLLTLTLGAFVPVTSFADDGIGYKAGAVTFNEYFEKYLELKGSYYI